MKNIFILIYSLISSLSAVFAQESFKTIDRLEEILPDLPGEDVLVIFDIDGTLIVPSSAFLDLSVCPRSFLKQLSVVYDQKDDLFETLFAQAWKESQQKLTEENIPVLLEQVKKKNIKVIGLTSRYEAKKWRSDRNRVKTIQQLESVGIDLSDSFKNHGRFKLGGKQNSEKRPAPSFYRGILFAARNDKGAVLGEFLDRIQYRPQKIIFVDDQLGFLSSVDQELNRRSIPHICYQYVGWEKNKSSHFDESLAAFQWLYFLVNKKCLSDDEAKVLFSKK